MDQIVEDKRKSKQHDLLVMPSCENKITSLWGVLLRSAPVFLQFSFQHLRIGGV